MDISDVIQRLGSYISEFDKNKDLNIARKAAESFCRILLLNSEITGAHEKAADSNLNTLIESLNFKNVKIPENHLKRIKDDLRTIQTFGNIVSHDNDEVLTTDDSDRVTTAMDSLIKSVFGSKDKLYIDQKIPSEIYYKLHKSVISDENWRCEKIISIVYPNRKIFKREVSKDFEFYCLDEADGRKIGILFLGRNIWFKQVFETVFKLDGLEKLSSLTFLFPVEISETTGTPVRNRKENIERISKEFTAKFSNMKCGFEFIEDYIWDRCLPESAKEITNPPDEPYFIDQKLHSEDFSLLGLNFIQSLVTNKLRTKKPIYVIFGDGGAGKTTFCDQAVQLINKYQSNGLKKKAILISSFDIPDELPSSGGIVDSLQSLYALVSGEDDIIDAHSLGLNVSSGNVLIIIDGLDEIQSKLKERFVLDKFIDSVRELNDTYLNCSVLMASREINQKSFESDDVHIFFIKGFDEQLIEKYLAKRFKGLDSAHRFVSRAREYMAELGSSSQVTPLILRLACELAAEGGEKLKHQQSEYFKFDQPLDKVIYQLMDREIGKQFLGIRTCDQYFEILRDIVFQYDGRVKEDELFDLVALALAGTGVDYDEGTSRNYHTSTLLARDKGHFAVKYDSLEFWVKARYLTYLINTKHAEKDFNILKEFAQSCYRGGVLVKEICKYKESSTDYESTVLQEFSKSMDGAKDQIVGRKLISALLHINFEGIASGRTENSERILGLFGESIGNEVKNLSIFGEFYPLDFSSFKVRDGYFSGYSGLGRSSIPEDEVVFLSSTFINFEKAFFGKKHLSWNNFDSDCVLCDELREVIEATSEDKEKRRDHVINDLKKIFRVGFKGGAFVWKSESVYKQQCASLKLNVGLSSLINSLASEGILLKELSKASSGIGFKLASEFSLEVKDFLTQSLPGDRLEKLIAKWLTM
ncbi:NACHT domain-containing protein [Pseudomonas sp. PAMC 26793]|uniref:NACHT domain-containing protein n=1 Tax=Pseudomonas sp. PAMC 26793 TaxID=1240676 RepID=UPI00030AE131|nr:NACHT domain-containing protein [Pseudomonas sp. PAMC 26793]